VENTDRLSQGINVNSADRVGGSGARHGPVAVQIYVFYHDQGMLRKALKGRSPESFGPSFSWIDLDTLELPPEAVIAGVDLGLNRAMLSEYLGILSVKPPEDAVMVGSFTYSIPLKFSLVWALETGNDHLFLPEVDFAAIEALLPQLQPDYLYGVEFKYPLADDRGPVRQLAEAQGGINQHARGPYKGSLICSRERFLELQAYLRQALPGILGFEEGQLEGVNNPFSAGRLAGRPPERAELDRRRSTYGNALERAMALAFSGKQDRRRQIRLGNLVRGQQVSGDPLLLAAHRAAFQGSVVLTFCNEPYLPVLQRWLEQARHAGIRGLLVVSFDGATSQFCQQHQLAVVEAEICFPDDLAELWRYRLDLTRRLLQTGLSVLLTDIDAYWLANPMPHLQAGDAHIVASQGTIYPRDVYEKTGIVLCCGFIYYRYSAVTLNCLEQLCQIAVNDPDDQRALNRWLLQQGLSWQIPDTLGRCNLPVPGHDLSFTAYDADIEGKASCGLQVRLLAHRQFQRVLDTSVRPIVSHLYVAKQSDAKLDAFTLLRRYPAAMPKRGEVAAQLKIEESAPSTLVWLASYPRSGNTMLRTWLQHGFRLMTCSVYNDVNDIGRDPGMRAMTGHYDRDWFYGDGGRFMALSPDDYVGFAPDRRLSSGIEVIKTHGLWNSGYGEDPAIYIYRDGRDALASHAHYRLAFARESNHAPESREERETAIRREIEELIVCGRPQCGYWSDNVCSWLEEAKSKQMLLLQFEQTIANPLRALTKLEAFLRRPLLHPVPPSFRRLQDVNRKFFRRGRSTSPEFNETLLQSLFFAFEWRGMKRAGYIDEYHWFVVDAKNELPTGKSPRLGMRDIAIVRYIRACIDAYGKNVSDRNRSSFQVKVSDVAERVSSLFSRGDSEMLLTEEESLYWRRLADGVNTVLRE
jgi:hypothetical protein